MGTRPGPIIYTHRTAIRRRALSKPVKCVVRDGHLLKTDTFLDYGCGWGDDVLELRDEGYEAYGYDPCYDLIRDNPHCGMHQPSSKSSYDVVNLGYVLNTIPEYDECAEALKRALVLTKKLLVVTLRIELPNYSSAFLHKDGYITSRSTFQRFFQSQHDAYAFIIQMADWNREIKIHKCINYRPAKGVRGVFYIFMKEFYERYQRYVVELGGFRHSQGGIP